MNSRDKQSAAKNNVAVEKLQCKRPSDGVPSESEDFDSMEEVEVQSIEDLVALIHQNNDQFTISNVRYVLNLPSSVQRIRERQSESSDGDMPFKLNKT
jgi:hypothetical protein